MASRKDWTELKWKFYKKWKTMKNRCNNSNSNHYHRYGGRGIKICKRWNTFENFWLDMSPSYKEGLTIDRRNNDKGYSPGNCRWATNKEQQQNKTYGSHKGKRSFYTYNGITLDSIEWSKRLNITIHTFNRRIYTGKKPEELFKVGFLKKSGRPKRLLI